MSEFIFFPLIHNVSLDDERKVKRHQLLSWEKSVLEHGWKGGTPEPSGFHVVVFWVTGGGKRYKRKGHRRQTTMTYNLSSAGSVEWWESNYTKTPPVR